MSLCPPETRREKQQNREDFQTAHHHVEGKHPLGGIGDGIEIAARPSDA